MVPVGLGEQDGVGFQPAMQQGRLDPMARGVGRTDAITDDRDLKTRRPGEGADRKRRRQPDEQPLQGQDVVHLRNSAWASVAWAWPA